MAKLASPQRISCATPPSRAPLLVVAGIAREDGRVLLTQRPEGSHLAGLWELPGGKIRPGEDPVAALEREWREELGCEVCEVEPFSFSFHAYPEKTVLLLCYALSVRTRPTPLEGQRMEWVALEELSEWPMPAADQGLVEKLCSAASR